MGKREHASITHYGAKYHGSCFGGCQHSMVLALLGGEKAKTPDNLQKVFDAGHLSEKLVKDGLTAGGFEVLYATADLEDQHETVIGKDFKYGDHSFRCEIHSHCDGCVTKVGDWEAAGFSSYPDAVPTPLNLLENKSGNDEVFRGYLEALKRGEDMGEYYYNYSRQYAYQIGANYWGIVLDLMKEGFEREYILDNLGILITIHCRETDPKKSDHCDERIAFYISKPPYTEDACLERCAEVYRLFLDNEIPKCDAKWPCGYYESRLPYAELRLKRNKSIQEESNHLELVNEMQEKLKSIKIKRN